KLVWKLMRELGIKGLPGPRKSVKNLKNAPTCEDLVQRQFRASAPNELWLTDITEHPTSEAKLYWLRRAGPLLPQGRRLGDRPTLRHCTGQRCPGQSTHRPDPQHGPSSTPTTAASSRRGASPRTCGASDWSPRWAPSATVTTTRPWSRFGAPCRSSCSTGNSGEPTSNSPSRSLTTSSTSTTQ